MEVLKLVREKAVKAAELAKKNKTKIAVGAALVVGNALVGEVFIQQQARVNKLEQIVGALVDKDVEKTRALCMTEGHILFDEGAPITYDIASEVCDEAAQKEMDEWREVLKGETASGKGELPKD